MNIVKPEGQLTEIYEADKLTFLVVYDHIWANKLKWWGTLELGDKYLGDMETSSLGGLPAVTYALGVKLTNYKDRLQTTVEVGKLCDIFFEYLNKEIGDKNVVVRRYPDILLEDHGKACIISCRLLLCNWTKEQFEDYKDDIR